MRYILRLTTIAAFCVLVTACAIQQTVRPITTSISSSLCIVKNPKVREGFLTAFESALDSKNVRYTVVDDHSTQEHCDWTATYSANWHWDMAVYMKHAEIKIYNRSCLAGEAVYDSSGAGPEKFIDAEVKVKELVNELIPYQSPY
jgi:hypothetical protein